MKKKLFALLLTLVMLLNMAPAVTVADDGHDHDDVAATALTGGPSDYECGYCGNPCDGWLQRSGYTHWPYCSNCDAGFGYVDIPCTIVEGTANCTYGPRCAVCNSSQMFENHAPDVHILEEAVSNGDGTHTGTCVLNVWHTVTEACYGGAATCSKQAACTICGDFYSELSSSVHSGIKHFPYDDDEHRSYCTDCYDYEAFIPHADNTGDGLCDDCGADCHEHQWVAGELDNGRAHNLVCTVEGCTTSQSTRWENHYGGDGSCKPACDGCGNSYYAQSGEHRNLGAWISFGSDEHYRFCYDCGSDLDYTAHADETGDGLCDDCDYVMSVACRHTNMSDWYFASDVQHYRYCQDCGEGEEYGNHTGGTATCASKAVCEVCNSAYGDYVTGHEWVVGAWYSEDEHYVKCSVSGCKVDARKEPHYGGDDTC